MKYQEALNYLFNRLPMFSRIGAAAYKANLDNTHALAKAFNHPENKFKSIHVAGTNGKGSTSHMLAAIMQSAGYKTGLYTSPHLLDFRERIRINGQMIPEAIVAEFTEQNLSLFEKIQPSFFEMTVALAFKWFADEKVDLAVVETGLGGRLDSTNIITPELSVITNISFDHMNLLGNTLEEIAEEKAGIIKTRTKVVIGERQSGISSVFSHKAKKENTIIHFAEDLCEVQNDKEIYTISYPDKSNKIRVRPALKGSYQKKNICTVLASCEMLIDQGWNISEDDIIKGIEQCVAFTGLRGRWEELQTHPIVIADIAHNPAGIEVLNEQIKLCRFKRLHMVVGMVSDKDVLKVLTLMPKYASYYFCRANLPRAMDAEDLAAKARLCQLQGRVIPEVENALSEALKEANADDLVLICGSAFVVAEALTFMEKIKLTGR